MSAPTASFSCHVLPGAAFTVVSGANQGDPLTTAEELCPGDVYRMANDARAQQIAVVDGGPGSGRVLAPQAAHRLAEASEIGTPGGTLSAEASLTFLAPEGHKVELLLLEIEGAGSAALPLEPMEAGRDHTLVGIAPVTDAVRLADITSSAFARGTRITLADGRQCPVEDLSAGMRVLTRDHGAQTLRWCLGRTLRAVGPYAPVVIPRDTLGNAADLILSQHQRLFIYQRGADRLTETAEMLVRAGHLADDDTVFLRPGGFIDYFSLVFDRHEVIYAECIPVESLEVSAATLPELSEDIAREVGDNLPGLDHAPHFGTEADKDIAEAARARLLRKLR